MATVLIENLTKIYPPTITYPHRVQALGGVNMSVTGNVFVAVLQRNPPPGHQLRRPGSVGRRVGRPRSELDSRGPDLGAPRRNHDR